MHCACIRHLASSCLHIYARQGFTRLPGVPNRDAYSSAHALRLRRSTPRRAAKPGRGLLIGQAIRVFAFMRRE